VAIAALIGISAAVLPRSSASGPATTPAPSSSAAAAGTGSAPPATRSQPAGTGIAASGTGPASPSTASGLDACLVGTWKEVTRTATNTNYLGQQVTLTAHGPATYTFRPDGTGKEVFSNDDFAGTVNGTPWTDVVAGTATYDYHASDGELLLTNAQASGTETLYANGFKYSTTPLAEKPAYTYTCSGNTLEATSTDGLYSYEATRSG
jgi:hypothetical protein